MCKNIVHFTEYEDNNDDEKDCISDTTWEKSDVRKWLNIDFYSKASNDSEKKNVVHSLITNDSSTINRSWNTVGGKNTTDYVFLLSYQEFVKYLHGTFKVHAYPTGYACAKNPWMMPPPNENMAFSWWLRSPGQYQFFAASYLDGYIEMGLQSGRIDHIIGVRPAIWVNATAI